ncbi:MAG TPA: hypothetical protein VK066_26920 [Chloroflexota bacterium]|nr:hypothetical protein [Chloroflexota bacterium]
MYPLGRRRVPRIVSLALVLILLGLLLALVSLWRLQLAAADSDRLQSRTPLTTVACPTTRPAQRATAPHARAAPPYALHCSNQ